MQLLEQIVDDLHQHAESDVRRQARRMKGALDAFWAEQGADDDSLTPHQAREIASYMKED